jgi:hypothetical protein
MLRYRDTYRYRYSEISKHRYRETERKGNTGVEKQRAVREKDD